MRVTARVAQALNANTLTKSLADAGIVGNRLKGKSWDARKGAEIVSEKLCGKYISSPVRVSSVSLILILSRRCRQIPRSNSGAAQRMHHNRRPSRGLSLLVQASRLSTTKMAPADGARVEVLRAVRQTTLGPTRLNISLHHSLRREPAVLLGELSNNPE